MSKAVDDILAFLRTETLSMEDQAELIARLRDGEADNARPAGAWVVDIPGGGLRSAEEGTFGVRWVHGPHVDQDEALTVSFFHGRTDGRPTIQIDGEAIFRINVNDYAIWDQSTEDAYEPPKEEA